MLAIDMARLAPECGRPFCIRQQPHGLTDDAVPMRLQSLEDLMVFVNAIARLKGWIGPEPGRLFSGFCNARQQPDDLRRVGEGDLAAAGRKVALQCGVHMALGHREDHDLVVGQRFYVQSCETLFTRQGLTAHPRPSAPPARSRRVAAVHPGRIGQRRWVPSVPYGLRRTRCAVRRPPRPLALVWWWRPRLRPIAPPYSEHLADYRYLADVRGAAGRSVRARLVDLRRDRWRFADLALDQAALPGVRYRRKRAKWLRPRHSKSRTTGAAAPVRSGARHPAERPQSAARRWR